MKVFDGCQNRKILKFEQRMNLDGKIGGGSWKYKIHILYLMRRVE